MSHFNIGLGFWAFQEGINFTRKRVFSVAAHVKQKVQFRFWLRLLKRRELPVVPVLLSVPAENGSDAWVFQFRFGS